MTSTRGERQPLSPRATLYWVVLICMFSQAGYGGSRVAVSLYALELGASQFAVGAIVALYALCATTLSIVIGRYADRTPPRVPVIVGTVAMAVMLLLPAAFGNLYLLGFVAFVLGLAHQIFSIPLEALIGGIGGPQRRAANYTAITLGWSIANMVGPIITGYLIDSVGHARVFPALAALVAMPLLILAWRPGLLPAVAAQQGGKSEAGGRIADLWRMKSLRNIILCAGIIGSAQDLFQFYMPVYGHSIGLSASAIGTILGTMYGAAFCVRAIIPWMVKRIPELKILTGAVFLAAVTYAAIPVFTHELVLAALAFALGLGVGCATPMTLSLLYALSPPGRVAEAIGLQKTVRHGSYLVVPMIFGSVGAVFGNVAVFLFNAALLGGSGMLMRKVRVTVKAPPSGGQ
jgi:MFS family permease